MRCPFCRGEDSRVVDSREVDEGQAIRRRRSCSGCGRRFTTVEELVLSVVKRSGVTEPFSREKMVRGVRRACQGRPVEEDALQQLAHRVEESVRALGVSELPSHEVGLAILGPLRELDEVAYLRFASVYRAFSSVEDFEEEIGDLRRIRGGKPSGDQANGDQANGDQANGAGSNGAGSNGGQRDDDQSADDHEGGDRQGTGRQATERQDRVTPESAG